MPRVVNLSLQHIADFRGLRRISPCLRAGGRVHRQARNYMCRPNASDNLIRLHQTRRGHLCHRDFRTLCSQTQPIHFSETPCGGWELVEHLDLHLDKKRRPRATRTTDTAAIIPFTEEMTRLDFPDVEVSPRGSIPTRQLVSKHDGKDLRDDGGTL